MYKLDLIKVSELNLFEIRDKINYSISIKLLYSFFLIYKNTITILLVESLYGFVLDLHSSSFLIFFFFLFFFIFLLLSFIFFLRLRSTEMLTELINSTS